MPSIRQIFLLTILYLCIFTFALPVKDVARESEDGFTNTVALARRVFCFKNCFGTKKPNPAPPPPPVQQPAPVVQQPAPVPPPSLGPPPPPPPPPGGRIQPAPRPPAPVTAPAAVSFKSESTAPNSLEINLQGKTFGLTKFSAQGNSGITYKVTGGSNIGSFAKTPFTGKGNLDREIGFTDTVDQLISSGVDATTQAQFIVVKAAPGSELPGTARFKQVQKDKTACQQLVDAAVTIAVNTAQQIRAQKGVNHNDLNPGNVFFDDQVTQATLIDWGQANDNAFDQAGATTQASIAFRVISSLCG